MNQDEAKQTKFIMKNQNDALKWKWIKMQWILLWTIILRDITQPSNVKQTNIIMEK